MNQAIFTPEQVLSSVKTANVVFAQFAAASFDAVEKHVDLSLKAARVNLADAAEVAGQVAGVKDVQELYGVTQSAAQPIAGKTTEYARNIYAINSEFTSEVSQLVEKQVADFNKSVAGMINEFSKAAPAGTEGVVSLVKSAFNASNTAYDTMNKSSKQFVEMVESNVEAVSKTGGVAAKAKKRAA